MEKEKGIDPSEELEKIEAEEGLDRKIDIEAKIGELELELHEAEFPSQGEPDEEKIAELRAKIDELKRQQEQIESEEV